MSAFITFEGQKVWKNNCNTTVAENSNMSIHRTYKRARRREDRRAIREVLLEGEDMDDRTEALLFAASRREHLR